MVLRLEDLIHRIDIDLHLKFESEGIQYMQFSFRWYVLLRVYVDMYRDIFIYKYVHVFIGLNVLYVI
jgi:hypothetical protein